MTVVEVMIGFGFNAFFQSGFDQLPPVVQSIKLGGLGALLVAMGLMLSPVAYHRIVTHGESTEGMHRFTTAMLGWACCHRQQAPASMCMLLCRRWQVQ